MRTLYGTAIIRGLELEFTSDCDVIWQDDSFSHEFGTEHCGHAEIETIYPLELEGDLREHAIAELRNKDKPHNRRKFIKWLRRIRRDIERIDPDEFYSEKEKDRAIEDWEPPEPDYDPPDREPGISSFAYD